MILMKFLNPNVVKVILNQAGVTIYFSRAPIAYLAIPCVQVCVNYFKKRSHCAILVLRLSRWLFARLRPNERIAFGKH